MDEAEGHSPEQAEKCGDQKTTTWWRGLSLNVRTSCLQDLALQYLFGHSPRVLDSMEVLEVFLVVAPVAVGITHSEY